MSARDLSKIGVLLLNDGMRNDVEVLSDEWIQESTASLSSTPYEGISY
jgi:hypothetical protein